MDEEMERFSCTVPSDQAVKGTEITCLGTAPDNYEVVGTVADWATVILTLLLVIAAAAAWFVTWSTLKQMRDDGKKADSRHAEDLEQRHEAESAKIQGDALFELLGCFSDLDEAMRVDKESINRVALRLRVAEQKFSMVNAFAKYPQELSDFNDCMLSLAYAAHDPMLSQHGAFSAYRKLTWAKFNVFSKFYRDEFTAEGLMEELEKLISEQMGDEPDLYPQHLIDTYY